MRILILLAVIGTTLAARNGGSRIVGGTPTTVLEYPYMSNMQFHWGGVLWSQWCGGTLLTSRTVLSAAHCYYGDIPSQWRVRLGTSFATTGGSIHNVTDLVLHEDYDDDTLVNDVAIVRLGIPAVFGPHISVGRIPGTAWNLPAGTNVTAIGWGALSSGGPAPEQLQHVDIHIIDQQICAQRYLALREVPGYEDWPYEVDDGMLCSGIFDVGGKDACQGDSGGPLTFKAADGHVVYGITSWGYGCAHEYYPGVNVRVAYYSDWVVENGSA